MANRWMANRLYSHEKDLKFVYARLVGTTPITNVAVLDVNASKGVASVTRVSAGRYTFNFGVLQNGVVVPDAYVKLVDAHYTLGQVAALSLTLSTIQAYLVEPAAGPVSAVDMVMLNDAGAAVDPQNTDVLHFSFVFGDSTAP